MFVVIYSFKVKKGREEEFRTSWENLTKLIYKYEGSLGSRLHLSDEGSFIAYAQWPYREAWENSGDKLPEDSESLSQRMRACCDDIQVLFRMSMTDDQLKPLI